MVDAVVNAGVVKVGREGRQRAAFTPNPVIRNRAFAATRTDITIGAPTTASTLPAGSILRQPEEFRFSSALTYQQNFTQWTTSQHNTDHKVRARKSYGYGNDTSMTVSAPVPGDQLLRAEGDFLADANGDFELTFAGNGALCRLWVDEQPTQDRPTDLGVTPFNGVQRYVKFSGLTPGFHRLMFEMEQSLPAFYGLVHRVGCELYPASLTSRGSLFWLGDSIGQSGTALMGNPTPPNNIQYFAGGFINNLGHLLGLSQVYGGYSQGGTGLIRSGPNGVPYIQRVAVDIGSTRPDAVAIQCSTNDAADPAYPAQVTAALVALVASIRAVVPDCRIIGVGPLGTPPAPDYGGPAMTAVVNNFIAGCTQAAIPYISTAGLFTGSAVAGGAVQGDGNADIYKSSFPADTVGAPHPNQAGHDRIARFLAPRLGRELGIDLSTTAPGVTVPTASGQWDT